jgi:hypothetical protein
MATILLVEDGATVSREVTCPLEAAGHRVMRCGGGPTPFAACLLLRYGRCPLVDSADLLVFACALALPLPGRSYRGIHLLRAYRAHPDYARLPLCWWPSRRRTILGDRGRSRWWRPTRTRLPWSPP